MDVRPAKRSRSIAEMADWTIALLSAAGADKAHLVGHSMGSLIALEAAARHPHSVTALSLIGTAAAMTVGPDLLKAAEANDHAAIDMVSIWGLGFQAELGGSQAPGLWMHGGAQSTLQRCQPGVLFNDLAACNAYQDALSRRRADHRPDHADPRRAGHDDAGQGRQDSGGGDPAVPHRGPRRRRPYVDDRTARRRARGDRALTGREASLNSIPDRSMKPFPISGEPSKRPDGLTSVTAHELRRRWRAGEEVALLDVREEGPYSLAHPFFAVSLPLSQIELRILDLIPRLSAPIVVYDNGEGYAQRAAARISAIGYSDIAILHGGLAAYAEVGEVFRDVNVPSKSFGELVEAIRHTPSLSADEAKALIERETDLVVLDARRFEEYRTMSIPRGVSVPGGELAFRAREIAPSPDTTIIVNCAGRTRSIIGTQSLINAGVPNKIFALRNGTIGWTLAGHDVVRGRTERAAAASGGDLPCGAVRREGMGRLASEFRCSTARRSTAFAARPMSAPSSARCPDARGICSGASTGLRLGAGRPAGAGDRRMGRGARCAARAVRR